jgi:6-phosphogluconolactonase
LCISHSYLIQVPIPKSQVYGIDESLLKVSTEAVASAYEETVLKPILQLSGGKIDCVILGFGPDGHTCSLFPNHPLLLHNDELRYVAPIDDSPKPPMSRITLTLPVLNKYSRHIIFCGAGSSKQPILNAVLNKPKYGFVQYAKVDNFSFIHLGVNYNWSFPQYDKAIVEMVNPSPLFPCGMVRPEEGEGERGNNDRLVWIVDNDAFPH